MNLNKLKEAEAEFLRRYPDGFLSPELQVTLKKHKMEKMIEFAQENFSSDKFSYAQTIAENMVKLTSRSSMVSMFEKPKFKDFVYSLQNNERDVLVEGLYEFLHGQQEKGFQVIVDSLRPAKLAKWSLVTILPNYYAPNEEVFVKPTTTKGVIKQFELDDMLYKPQPTWDFYQRYRDIILEMKSWVDVSLAPSNAAFCGFLMMSL